MPTSTPKPSYADDRAAIEDLMARYLFALDWNDFETFGQTFTEDAEFEYARGKARGRRCGWSRRFVVSRNASVPSISTNRAIPQPCGMSWLKR